jgi:hypothetical protein
MRSRLFLFPARMSRDIRREALKQCVEQGGDTSRQELITALIAGIPLTSHRIGPCLSDASSAFPLSIAIVPAASSHSTAAARVETRWCRRFGAASALAAADVADQCLRMFYEGQRKAEIFVLLFKQVCRDHPLQSLLPSNSH